eukprot:scaffold2096_cov221-Pinguiococcus_pyrenoidosus.AAC.3
MRRREMRRREMKRETRWPHCALCGDARRQSGNKARVPSSIGVRKRPGAIVHTLEGRFLR